jgi:hypothetical protein
VNVRPDKSLRIRGLKLRRFGARSYGRAILRRSGLGVFDCRGCPRGGQWKRLEKRTAAHRQLSPSVISK